jgi:D-glucuronyl C5-epimerase C-terminus
MDACRPLTRMAKARAFFQPQTSTPVSMFSQPWKLSSPPYYLVEGLENSDRRGGYASMLSLDADGVPYRCDPRGGRTYHPLVVARYVLRMCSLGALTDDAGAFKAAERAALALVSSGAATGVWQPGADPDGMRGTAPSCIVQGTAISALVRVRHQAPLAVPRAVIERGVDALIAPVSGGGTVTHSLGGPFFEEFESRSHVLNGCVYALWAVYDVVDGLGLAALNPLAQSVESCLARVLPRYTTASGWSLYALDTYGYAPLASVHYHQSHIRMFSLLHTRTGEPSYGAFARRWTKALESRVTRYAALAQKSAQVIWMRDVCGLPLAHSIWN